MEARLRSLLSVLFVAFAVAVAAGCGSDSPSSPSPDGYGTLRVRMTDAPGEFDAVNLVITEVSVRGETVTTPEDTDTVLIDASGEWVVLSDGPKTFDLIQLQNGVFATIGEGSLPAGHYQEVRLRIGTGSTVVVDGVTYPLTVPSGAQTGLKLKGAFDVVEDGVTDLGIDFDAARSIHETGNGKWMMRPVARMVPVAASGGIDGTIVPDSTAATVWLLQAPDSVASTVPALDGSFRFAMVPPGTYDVRIEPEGAWRDTTFTGVTVSSGSTTHLGVVALTPQ